VTAREEYIRLCEYLQKSEALIAQCNEVESESPMTQHTKDSVYRLEQEAEWARDRLDVLWRKLDPDDVLFVDSHFNWRQG
jgi:hypothetical protein